MQDIFYLSYSGVFFISFLLSYSGVLILPLSSIYFSSYSVNTRHAGWEFYSHPNNIVCKLLNHYDVSNVVFLIMRWKEEKYDFAIFLSYIYIQKTVAGGANIHTSVAAWPSHEMFREKVKRFRRNGV